MNIEFYLNYWQCTFFEKAVDLVHCSRLMVAPQHVKAFGIFYFESEEQANAFDSLTSPVHIITQKQVRWFRGEAPELEYSEQIIVLAMDISANLHRSINFHQHGLLQKHIPHKAQEPINFFFSQTGNLTRSLEAEIEEPIENRIDIDLFLFWHFRLNYIKLGSENCFKWFVRSSPIAYITSSSPVTFTTQWMLFRSHWSSRTTVLCFYILLIKSLSRLSSYK